MDRPPSIKSSSEKHSTIQVPPPTAVARAHVRPRITCLFNTLVRTLRHT